MTKRQKLARECLRKIWQIFDSGGHSLGRSEQSLLLESAMRLLGQDSTYSNLADREYQQFLRLVKDQERKIAAADQKKRDAMLFAGTRRRAKK